MHISTLPLTAPTDPDSDAGVLESYLSEIRKNGVSRHAKMAQQIDTVVNNNAAVVALSAAYSTHAKTEGFRLSTGKFRDYADNFRDRWQSVFEIFMAGGNLPSAGAPYPADFAATVSQGLSLIR
jgi:hypothetical protein